MACPSRRTGGSSPRGRGKPHARPVAARGDGLIPARAGKTSSEVASPGTQPAHPRAGGENHRRWSAQGPSPGSSPRGRGKRPRRTWGREPCRLIPARAGKTPPTRPPTSPPGAHPRAGGENAGSRVATVIAPGSSPRGRGKPGCPGGRRQARGLIPARAGKTRLSRRAAASSRAHPRAGGENAHRVMRPSARVGSSPRGRGKLNPDRAQAGEARLIPARAGKTVCSIIKASVAAAHPRAGGENNARRGMRYRGAGSSPRGRGKRGDGGDDEEDGGLIPARAGKTDRRSRRSVVHSAHPRAGGENAGVAGLDDYGRGSSPRGRGKRDHYRPAVWHRRLIPARAGKTFAASAVAGRPSAHPRAGGENAGTSIGAGPSTGLIPARAGKTRPKPRTRTWSPAHPRAGGENSLPSGCAVFSIGSSPRGRGKPSVSGDGHWCVRLIPARAGKTRASRAWMTTGGAHPRAGGENAIITDPPYGIAGSSPRGRGKHSPRRRLPGVRRLIPARAGKTTGAPVAARHTGAHPRAGGENSLVRATPATSLGSSPRGRGKLRPSARHGTRNRLIPARAGKTRCAASSRTKRAAHPRAGGENRLDPDGVRLALGSSPRGRGKLSEAGADDALRRLIPARAGKTA